MTRFSPLLRPALTLAFVVAAVGPLQAQATPADGAQTIRLSPEQIAKARDSATSSTDADLIGGGLSRGIHGEVGVMVGTNGARGAYGIAAIPLGENAGAVVSFEDSRFGHR